MTFPITQISEPPSKSDPQAVFDIKTEALLESLILTVETANDAFQSLSLDHKTTSTSTHTIGGDGLYAFIVGTGLGFVVGMYLTAAATSSPQNNISGLVNSYNSLTGLLVISVDAKNGVGAFSEWTISVAVQNKEPPIVLASTTTGTSGSYIAMVSDVLTQIKDGMILSIKFHVDCASIATLQVNGLLPLLDLKIKRSDGTLAPVAAGDIKGGDTLIGHVVDGASFVVEPSVERAAVTYLSSPTTLTLESALDVSFFCTAAATHTFPMLSTFNEGSGFFFSTSATVTLQRQSSDVISLNNTDSTAITLNAGDNLDVVKSSGKWLCVISRKESIGIRQTWQNMTSVRAANTTYVNTTGLPIFVQVYSAVATSTSTTAIIFTVNGLAITGTVNTNSGGAATGAAGILIPQDATYSVNTSTTWWELR